MPINSNGQSGWAKIRKAAQFADVSPRTLRDWLKEGLTYSQMPTGTILIRYSAIDEFISRYEVRKNQIDEIVSEVCKDLK